MDTKSGLAILAEAASVNGLSSKGLEVIRNGSHLICKVDGLVARVGEAGSENRALREIGASQWLARNGVPVVETVEDVRQPTIVARHPVTWWRMLGEHRHATPSELARVLRQLHQVPASDRFCLPRLSPLDGAMEKLSRAHLSVRDREWLGRKVQSCRDDFEQLCRSGPIGVVHGDAWQGNVVVLGSGHAVLVDLESVCLGPTEWDLIAVAADYVDFSRISADEYESFVAAYGSDVTQSPSFRLMADIQELRWLLYVLGKATNDAAAAKEVAHRIACIRGEIERPWQWKAF